VRVYFGAVNNGVVYRPHVVKEIRSNDNGRVLNAMHRQKVRELPLSPLTLQAVKKGMRLSVMSGTSGRLGYLKVPVAGKTGTAQTRSIRQEKYSQHAWFVGYAPYEGPPETAIATVILIEYGIAGAASAVPIAERVYSKLLELGYFTAAPQPKPDAPLKKQPAGNRPRLPLRSRLPARRPRLPESLIYLRQGKRHDAWFLVVQLWDLCSFIILPSPRGEGRGGEGK